MTDEAGNQKANHTPSPISCLCLSVWKGRTGVPAGSGADLSGKLLHIGQGFSAAFASAAPSFHPSDLLIGLAAAVIIRLVVYSKQKNAKKYRKGMEYGTARWSA